MTVTIRFRGPIAARIPGGVVKIEVQDSLTVADLLSLLIEQDPHLQAVWSSPTEIDRNSMILRNEVDIGVTGGLGSPVGDGDVVVIVPLVHGG